MTAVSSIVADFAVRGARSREALAESSLVGIGLAGRAGAGFGAGSQGGLVWRWLIQGFGGGCGWALVRFSAEAVAVVGAEAALFRIHTCRWGCYGRPTGERCCNSDAVVGEGGEVCLEAVVLAGDIADEVRNCTRLDVSVVGW